MGNAGSIGDSILFPAPPSSYSIDLPCMIWIDEEFGSDALTANKKASTSSSPSSSSPSSSSASFPSTSKYSSTSNSAHKDSSKNDHDDGKNTIKISSSGSFNFISAQTFPGSLATELGRKFFPAIFLKYEHPTKHMLLYFHGNSCDLGQVFEELTMLGNYLECNICAVEFPGYGLRSDLPTKADTIDQWGRSAFNYLVWLGIPPSSIICFGRSIGTGPACKLASTLHQEGIEVGGVILHAPYVSVHNIVSDYSPLGTWLIPNYWRNLDAMQSMAGSNCPLLVIHGLDDEVIGTDHGRKVHAEYKGSCKEGFFPADSSHNSYYIIDDLGKPIEKFLKTMSRSRLCDAMNVEIDDRAYVVPDHVKDVLHEYLARAELDPTIPTLSTYNKSSSSRSTSGGVRAVGGSSSSSSSGSGNGDVGAKSSSSARKNGANGGTSGINVSLGARECTFEEGSKKQNSGVSLTLGGSPTSSKSSSQKFSSTPLSFSSSPSRETGPHGRGEGGGRHGLSDFDIMLESGVFAEPSMNEMTRSAIPETSSATASRSRLSSTHDRGRQAAKLKGDRHSFSGTMSQRLQHRLSRHYASSPLNCHRQMSLPSSLATSYFNSQDRGVERANPLFQNNPYRSGDSLMSIQCNTRCQNDPQPRRK